MKINVEKLTDDLARLIAASIVAACYIATAYAVACFAVLDFVKLDMACLRLGFAVIAIGIYLHMGKMRKA